MSTEYTKVSTGGQITEAERHNFENKGEVLEGVLLDKVTLSSDDGRPFQKYILKTPTGNKSFLGSHQLDSALGRIDLGSQVKIVYQGKKKLSGGRTLREYDVFAMASGTKSAADVIKSARAS